MSDVEVRLQECFKTAFPDVAPGNIETTALETTPQWDSMATVILITVIEEQFDISIDLNDLSKLTSYSSILEYLQIRAQSVSGRSEISGQV